MEEAVIRANAGIEDFVREEAARYSLTVLEFTEGQSLAVYTDGYDANNDVSLMSLYTAAGLSTLFQTNFFRLFSRYCTGV